MPVTPATPPKRSRPSLANRIFGDPPAPTATRLERMIWIRHACLRTAPLIVFIYALAAFATLAPLVWVLIALFTAPWFLVILSTTAQIRIERGKNGG
jgi:hypothetical protein